METYTKEQVLELLERRTRADTLSGIIERLAPEMSQSEVNLLVEYYQIETANMPQADQQDEDEEEDPDAFPE